MHPSALFLRLAIQHLGHRPGRAVLLALAVACGGGGVFTSAVLRRSLHDSMAISLNRMGADAMVVPAGTTVHLSSALLALEPTSDTLEPSVVVAIRALPGVELSAPQRSCTIPDAGGEHGQTDVIAFDPAADLTVLPWVVEKLDRPFGAGDLIVGGRRPEAVGSQVAVFGRSYTVFGKLALTGVGPFERSLFVSFDTLAEMSAGAEQARGKPLVDVPDRCSALLVRLRVGATLEQFRFAAARIPEIHVVTGSGLATSVRQGLTALLDGAALFTWLILVTTILLVWGMYSGMLSERRQELGLLLALGMRPAQLMRLIVFEAGLVSGLGGACGVLLGSAGLAAVRRSLVYHFELNRVPFSLPALYDLIAAALVSIAICAGVGIAGALIPAWSAGRQEPFALVRGEAP